MQNPTIYQIADTLSGGALSWSSIEMRVETTRNVREKFVGNPYVSSKEHYIETGVGRRFYEWSFTAVDGKVYRKQAFTDGTKSATSRFDPQAPTRQTQVEIRRSFLNEDLGGRTTRPVPLALLYVDQQPLDKILLRGRVLGPSLHLDRPCLSILLSQVRAGKTLKQDLVYHFDTSTALPLRVESSSGGKTNWYWEALSIGEVAGRPIALVSRERAFDPDGELFADVEYRVLDVKFDIDYPESLFWPTIGENVRIFDGFKDTMHRTPGGPPSTPPASESATGAITPATPAMIATPGSGWPSWSAPVTLAIGVALLVAAIGIRLRRRTA